MICRSEILARIRVTNELHNLINLQLHEVHTADSQLASNEGGSSLEQVIFPTESLSIHWLQSIILFASRSCKTSACALIHSQPHPSRKPQRWQTPHRLHIDIRRSMLRPIVETSNQRTLIFVLMPLEALGIVMVVECPLENKQSAAKWRKLTNVKTAKIMRTIRKMLMMIWLRACIIRCNVVTVAFRDIFGECEDPARLRGTSKCRKKDRTLSFITQTIMLVRQVLSLRKSDGRSS